MPAKHGMGDIVGLMDVCVLMMDTCIYMALCLQSRCPTDHFVPFQKQQEAPAQPIGASRLLLIIRSSSSLLLITAVKASNILIISSRGGSSYDIPAASALSSIDTCTSTRCRAVTTRFVVQLSLGRLYGCNAEHVALCLGMLCL